MTITFALTCVKTGAHLFDTLRSIFDSAARTEQSVTVYILTQLSNETFTSIPKDPTGKVPVRIMTMERSTGIMFRFDRFLSIHKAEDPNEIMVFSNDDVIFATDFIANLADSPVDNRIVGPLIRTPDGSWQTSMFRKRFSFFRLMFRIHDGGLYSRFLRLPTTLDGLNQDRVTVDGCCFILNERTLRRFGRRFNFVSFLYMEEALFQAIHDRFGIQPEVCRSIKVTHLGGASLPHVWSPGKSELQVDSVTAVSRAYLGHTPWQTAVLRGWFRLEGFVRRLIAKSM